MKVTRLKEIDLADIERTYRGDVGCACGCGGDYYTAGEEAHAKEVAKHVKYVNARVENAEVNGTYAGAENPAYTKATRLYFIEGVRYYKTPYGLDRIEA